MPDRNRKCEDRIDAELESTLEDLRRLWNAYQSGDEEDVEDLGRFEEYGLCFDYVAAGTFGDQTEGYFRYQLSWGGPSSEFRFFTDAGNSLHRIEFWFLDWFDGAHRVLSGDNEKLLREIFSWFDEAGCVGSELEKAREQ